MMLLNICPEEHDMPLMLDHDNVITAAISFHAYRLQAETRLKQYIKDHAGEHKKVYSPI